MNRLLVTLFVLLVLVPCAQGQIEKLEIRDIKGLNTVATDFAMQPNDSRIAHNIDFGRYLRGLGKRYGYSYVSAVGDTLFDSLVAVYGAPYSDGTQQLFFVAAIKDSGYGAVFVTDYGSADVGSATRIWDNFSIINQPTFAMYDDMVVAVNGSHGGFVYNRDIARELPPGAPGQPRIVPLMGTTDNLTGEYRYIFKNVTYYGTDSVSGHVGAVSEPVHVKNGSVRMSGFQCAGIDIDATSVDSMHVFIYRTKANPGYIDESDYAFAVDTLWSLVSATISDQVFIDNIADGNLGNDSVIMVEDTLYGFADESTYTRRYGAPTYIDSAYGSGLYDGWIGEVSDTVGYAYRVTFVDTVLGVESAASVPLAIYTDSASVTASYTIGLPPIPSNDSGLVYNLYRSPIYAVTHDSTFLDTWEELVAEEWICDDGVEYKSWMTDCIYIKQETVTRTGYKPLAVLDDMYTPIGGYRMVAQIPSDSSQWTDDVTQRELELSPMLHPQYFREIPEGPLDNIFSFDGRLYGMNKSTLSWTDSEEPFKWGGLNYININPNDGDVLTAGWPARTVLRICKNRSIHNVYPGVDPSNSDWGRSEISTQSGCIAPKSHAASAYGHYYLTDNGVVLETEGANLERTFGYAPVSASLDNFTNMSMADRARAYGFSFDEKYMLSIGDTTYVLDEKAGGAWATWGMSFISATRYSTESELNFLPLSDMYFVRSGDTCLYKYKGSELDAYGSADVDTVQFLWSPAVLFVDEQYERIVDVTLWMDTPSITYPVNFVFTTETSVDGGNVEVGFETLTSRGTIMSVNSNPSLFWTFIVYTRDTSTANSAYGIEGIDIYYKTDGTKTAGE